jgi:hypothetical protein
MAKKIDEIFKDLNSYIDKIEDSIDERVAAGIAYTVRSRMLSLISKGISPILGWGRFPEYKNVKQVNSLKRSASQLRRQLKTGSGSAARIKRALGQNQRNQSKSKLGYPYSVQKDFPQKRPRPVNLFLSGDFLSNLTYALGRSGKKQVVTIGFFDELSKKKESGHRVGVNGQPKRPIIPASSESFSQIIKLDILKIMKDVLKKASKR